MVFPHLIGKPTTTAFLVHTITPLRQATKHSNTMANRQPEEFQAFEAGQREATPARLVRVSSLRHQCADVC